jgi:cell division protein FtsA
LNLFKLSFLKKLSSLIGGKDGSNCLLALDIGTESVRAAIFDMEEGEKNKLKAVVRGVGGMTMAASEGKENFIAEVVEVCRLVKKEAENMAGVEVNRAIIGMTGQSLKCSTALVSYDRKNASEIINLSEIKNIIQKSQWRAFDDLRKREAKECGLSETEIKLVDGLITNVKVDGYRVSDPIGFEGKEITLTIFNIYTSLFYLDLLRRLKKTLGIEIVASIPAFFAIENALAENVFKTINLSEISGIFIDCGVSATDVVISHQEIIEGPKTICFGGRTFTRRLSSQLQLKDEDAERLKKKYSENQVSSLVKRKIAEILTPSLKMWLDGIKATLQEFSFLDSFPLLILIVEGGGISSLLKRALESQEWQEGLNLSRGIKVKVLRLSDIPDVEDETGLLNDSSDINLLALINFSLKIRREKSTLNSILARAIRLMQV